MLYTAYTDADVALTAATAKTSLLIIPPSGFGYNLCVVEVGAEFEGAVQATDCLVELVESTQATAGTSGSAAAAKQLRGSRAISLRLTSPIAVSARCHITFAVGWR